MPLKRIKNGTLWIDEYHKDSRFGLNGKLLLKKITIIKLNQLNNQNRIPEYLSRLPMINKDKVSVIVPCRNEVNFIDSFINNIDNQK